MRGAEHAYSSCCSFLGLTAIESSKVHLYGPIIHELEKKLTQKPTAGGRRFSPIVSIVLPLLQVRLFFETNYVHAFNLAFHSNVSITLMYSL